MISERTSGFQPVQVVWQNDPDRDKYPNTAEHEDYGDYMERFYSKGPAWKAKLPMVGKKATQLFGYPNQEYINLTVWNYFSTQKDIRFKFRVWPDGQETGSSREIYVSKTFTVEAGKDDDSDGCYDDPVGNETFTIDAPIPSPEWFRFNKTNPIPIWEHPWIEVEVVQSDNSTFNDADSTNQDAWVKTTVTDPDGEKILFVPADFIDSPRGRRYFSQPKFGREVLHANWFIEGTFPVYDSVGGFQIAGRGDPLPKQFEKATADGLGVAYYVNPYKFEADILGPHNPRTLGQWKSQPDYYQSGWTSEMADKFSAVCRNTKWDRVVLLVPPGYFEDDEGVQSGAHHPFSGKCVAVVEWGTAATVKAHELGHSYRLWSALDWEDEEYELPDHLDNTNAGRNANGYWVRKSIGGMGSFGGNPGRGEPFSAGVYNDFMGTTETTALAWIDQDNYVELFGNFLIIPDPKILSVRGEIFPNGTIELSPWFLKDQGVADVTANTTRNRSNHSVVLLDSGGNVLEDYNVSLTGPYHRNESRWNLSAVPFDVRVPWTSGVERVVIKNATGATLAQRRVTDHAPNASVIRPRPGETIRQNNSYMISWNASDPDGGNFSYSVFIRHANGSMWLPLRPELNRPRAVWNTSEFAPGTFQVRVVASDGVRTGSVTSGNFTLVRSNVTTVALNLTANTTAPVAGDPVAFTVTRQDTGNTVNATITVNNTTLVTGSDGRVPYTFVEAGNVTATASKPNTTTETFANESVTVTVLEPANVSVINYTVNRTHVTVGQPIEINATVENTGDVNASINVTFFVDGKPFATKHLFVEAGYDQLTAKDVRFSIVGAHTVTVNDLPPTNITVERAGAMVSVESGTTPVGSTVELDVMLSTAPDGLSGYEMNATVVNGSVAAIEGASYPSSFGLSQTAISKDNTSITLKATDLRNGTKPGDTNITLATVRVKGRSKGETRTTVEVEQIDDDFGDSVNASTLPGTITVRACPALAPGLGTSMDPDGDGLAEDMNANGRKDFDDVVTFFDHMSNTTPACQDFNQNGRIDFDDLVELFGEI